MIDSIARTSSHLLTLLFFTGLGGSLIVVAITIVRDLREVLSEDEAVPAPEKVVSAN